MILFCSRLISCLQSDSRNRRSFVILLISSNGLVCGECPNLVHVVQEVEDLVLIGLSNRARGGVLQGNHFSVG